MAETSSRAKKVTTSREVQRENRKKSLLGFRWILAFLGFCLYFNMCYQRNSFPVVLLSMVNVNIWNKEDVRNHTTVRTYQDPNDQLKMTNTEQGIVSSAFLWGFFLTKLFGRRIGQELGPRITVAWGVGCSGILMYLTPFSANVHPYFLAANRFLIGALYGPLLTTLNSLLCAWALKEELSLMVIIAYSGSSFGGMVGLLLSVWFQGDYGWKITLWLGGTMNLLFLPFWILLVRNSPKEHPLLSNYERDLLKEQDHITMKEEEVPWLEMLRSPCLYICIMGNFAKSYLDATVTAKGPSFFTNEVGLSLEAACLVCAAHYLMAFLSLPLLGRLSYLMTERKLFSKIRIRKLFHSLGAGFSALLLFGVTFAGCNITASITLWILIGASTEGTIFSYSLSVIDVAPNFAAFFMDLVTIGNIGGPVAPSITSAFLNLTENGWTKALYAAGGVNLLSWLVYDAFMTAERQPWNSSDKGGDTEV